MAHGADSLRVLEWDTVRQQLAALSCTPQARGRLARLVPLEHYDEQVVALDFAAECLELLQTGNPLPLRPLVDLEPILQSAVPQGALMEGPELALIGDFGRLTGELCACQKQFPDRLAKIKEALGRMVAVPDLVRAVEKALEPDGSLKDAASPALLRLRQKRQRVERTLLATLEKTASSVSPDSVVTLREGRYVVSVPEGSRRQVKGIVHDRSQSGTTYFIEPLAAIDQGNQLRAAEADIRDEIRRILLELTTRVRDSLPALLENLKQVSDLDLIWTKARWAYRLGGCVPRRTPEPELKLLGARHPLLLDQYVSRFGSLESALASVIPFDLSLDSRCRCVVISGPNTGGKTVCLKSMGLAVLLVQSGVPACVAADSSVGHFDAVFADIGDDQSLALSLSTFSAHLKHVGMACRHATHRSLVLLDELGVGTDPEEGGALALAVLEALLTRGAALVVTTHYPVLKLLSREDGSVAHAAFAFSQSDLAPTYELKMGRPGQSYALDVARRLGFPTDIVNSASRMVSEESRNLSALLDRLAARERELGEALSREKEKEYRLDALIAYNSQEETRWRDLQKRAEGEARSQAAEIVSEARRETEHLVAEIRRTQAHPEAVRKAQRELSEWARKTRPAPVAPGASTLELGARVLLVDLGREGEITRISGDGRRISVRVGNVTYTVAPDRVSRIDSDGAAPEAATLSAGMPAASEEIDVRGLSVDEAMLELDSAIQLAASGGVRELHVIHGVGTGVLRRELSIWFRRHARVASFRRGLPGEGSDGVTVLILKS